MNKKGFTLVELLASLAILAIIMLIAVPSTINVLDRSKKQKYIADAKKMITLAETYIRGNQDINYPSDNQIIILYLSALNDGSFDEDPDGNKYSLSKSFVTITRKQVSSNYTYEYKVQLVGIGSNNLKRGVSYASLDQLNSDKKYDYVLKDTTSAVKIKDITCQSLGYTSANCPEYR